MRHILGGLILALTLAAVAGCTTRTDREKNKDYDKPRSSAKG